LIFIDFFINQKISNRFSYKKFMVTTFSSILSISKHNALKRLFRFFPEFLKRISENWTFINVLFYMTPPTFFWEFFLNMIELFIILFIKTFLLYSRRIDILIQNYLIKMVFRLILLIFLSIFINKNQRKKRKKLRPFLEPNLRNLIKKLNYKYFQTIYANNYIYQFSCVKNAKNCISFWGNNSVSAILSHYKYFIYANNIFNEK